MSNLRFLNTFISKQVSLFGLLGLLLLSPLAFAEIKGFEDFNGKPQVLENYTGKGKWLLVMIWASDCHICNREAHEYVDFHLVHSETNATVLGISVDGENRKKAAENFIKKHSIDFPNIIAEPEYMSTVYRDLTGSFFAGTPTIMLYSPSGE